MEAVQLVKKENKRIASIELIRVIACVFVIINHTIPDLVVYKSPSTEWFTILTYFIISRVAIPLFLIITGFNMLDKKTTYKSTFKKAFRFVLVLLLFNTVYYIKNKVIVGADDVGILNFLKLFICGRIYSTLWYLYLYIFILILMPFMQKLFSKFKRTDFHVFLLLTLAASCVIPNIEHYFSSFYLEHLGMLDGLSIYVFYLTIGLYFKKYKYVLVESKKANLVLYVLSLIAGIILTYMEYLRVDGSEYFYYSNSYSLTIIVATICFFRLLYDIEIKEGLGKIIKYFGSLSLTIYLVADLFIESLQFIREGLIDNGLSALLSCIVYQIAVVGCSIIVSIILKHIPGIKKIL